MVEMPGGIAQLPPIFPAHHIEHTPNGLSWNTQNDIIASRSLKRSERRGRVFHMLQHLATHKKVGTITALL